MNKYISLVDELEKAIFSLENLLERGAKCRVRVYANGDYYRQIDRRSRNIQAGR